MKLVSFKKDLKIVPGIIVGQQVIELTALYSSMQQLIDDGVEAQPKISAFLQTNPHAKRLDSQKLVAPLPALNRNIFCVGWNYLKHFEERARQDIDLPEHPTIFTKATTTIAGPFETIPFSKEFTNAFDYEAELAIVIGKQGKGIQEEEALDYVFGYLCANDLSARDVQQKHGGQWFMGKSMDQSCPLGPWIVTKGEIADVQQLDIICRVNGEIVQQSNTSLMIFSVSRIIAELSKSMTLLPGDVILTGTPDGIGSKRNPPLLLKQDDVVEVSISQIGSITNRIQEMVSIKH